MLQKWTDTFYVDETLTLICQRNQKFKFWQRLFIVDISIQFYFASVFCCYFCLSLRTLFYCFFFYFSSSSAHVCCIVNLLCFSQLYQYIGGIWFLCTVYLCLVKALPRIAGFICTLHLPLYVSPLIPPLMFSCKCD